MRFTSLLERRCYTWELLVERVSVTLLISLDPYVCFAVSPTFIRLNLWCMLLQEGTVYAVEFSHRPGRDLINMAKKRTNVIRKIHLPFDHFWFPY